MFNQRDTTDEEGFTLIETAITVVMFSMFSIVAFGMVNTAIAVQEQAATRAEASLTSERAFDKLSEDVRLSPESRVSEDGDTLYLLTQEHDVLVWEQTEEGLVGSDGTIFDDVSEVTFEKFGRVIATTLGFESGEEVEGFSSSRFQLGETTLTDSRLESAGVLDD